MTKRAYSQIENLAWENSAKQFIKSLEKIIVNYEEAIMDICCIIVTYNRLQLLKESINSVSMYKDKIKKIIVVNNASTDGTTEYLDNICNSENKLVHVKLEKNIGGSGGFYEGIKKSFEYNCDWVWIMDDDTIVKKGFFRKLN